MRAVTRAEDGSVTSTNAPVVDPARRANRLAWWSLALFPVCFVAAFVVGEGLLTMTGYGDQDAAVVPLWAIAVAGLPALAVFTAPALVTVHYGRRAMRLGRREGLTPVVVALTVAGAFVALNVLPFVVGRIFGL